MNKDLIQLLLNIPTNEALDWLEDLHEPKHFVFRTTKKTDQELNLQIKLQELDMFLEEHLRTGHIQPSESPMASPFFFVKKKDGRLRPVQTIESSTT